MNFRSIFSEIEPEKVNKSIYYGILINSVNFIKIKINNEEDQLFAMV